MPQNAMPWCGVAYPLSHTHTGAVPPVQPGRAEVLVDVLELLQGDTHGGQVPLRGLHGLRPLQGTVKGEAPAWWGGHGTHGAHMRE